MKYAAENRDREKKKENKWRWKPLTECGFNLRHMIHAARHSNRFVLYISNDIHIVAERFHAYFVYYCNVLLFGSALAAPLIIASPPKGPNRLIAIAFIEVKSNVPEGLQVDTVRTPFASTFSFHPRIKRQTVHFGVCAGTAGLSKCKPNTIQASTFDSKS